MIFPKMTLVRQKLLDQKLEEIPGAVAEALQRIPLMDAAVPGESVAIAVGSRGIADIAVIVSQCVRLLKSGGFEPFIVPAMGSHGGNTDQGERSVLRTLGIDESTVETPIVAGGEPVEIGELDMGVPVLMDRHAAEADHLVVINRVKPHTKFQGPPGSGLTKILTIGLGKGRGAALYHRAAVQHSFSILQDAARHILASKSVLFGLAILEDGCGNVSRINAVSRKAWFETEQTLLKEARSAMPGIPFDPVDLLIVDQMGKDISGIGMDSNVTGRHRDIVGDYCTAPHAKRIFVRDLTPGSHGNGNGIGLADVTTRRLVEALDVERTYENALTAISPEKAAIPIHFETDQECIQACLNMIGMVSPHEARIVRIKDTAHLETLWVSQALEDEVRSSPDLTILESWKPMTFDDVGNLMA
jgi:hypothetical protein